MKTLLFALTALLMLARVASADIINLYSGGPITDVPGQPLQLTFTYSSEGTCIHCQAIWLEWNFMQAPYLYADNYSGAYTHTVTLTGPTNYNEVNNVYTPQLVSTGSDILQFFTQGFRCAEGGSGQYTCATGTVSEQTIFISDVSLTYANPQAVPGPALGAGLPGLLALIVYAGSRRRWKKILLRRLSAGTNSGGGRSSLRSPPSTVASASQILSTVCL